MDNNTCMLCNTALVDNLIRCSGRCNRFFHYTCAGMSRTMFDGYKKVEGLRWQCSDCINDLKVIWSKLDELVLAVNEIRSTISLGSLVKSAISDVFRDRDPSFKPSENNNCGSLAECTAQSFVKSKNKKKKRRANGKNRLKSSTPVNGTVIQTTLASQSSSERTIVGTPSIDSASTQTIRNAENRTYLWLNGFHHQTTSKQIIDLVAKTMNVSGTDVICRSLKSSRRTYSDGDPISFRVGLKTADVKDALTTDRWPKGVMCKLFNSKNSNARQPVVLG